MNRKIPKPFDIYRHFKGNHYQIICIAKNAENGEDTVVYQALYGDYSFYTRPLSQFLSEVDHEKYPGAAQQYRFQEISLSAGMASKDPQSVPTPGEVLRNPQSVSTPEEAPGNLQSGSAMEAVPQIIAQKKINLELAEPKPGEADPALLAFLDADTMEEKSNVLFAIRHRVTDRLIDDFAVTLDVVIPEGNIDARYQQLLSSIRMMQKYEIERQR